MQLTTSNKRLVHLWLALVNVDAEENQNKKHESKLAEAALAAKNKEAEAAATVAKGKKGEKFRKSGGVSGLKSSLKCVEDSEPVGP